jgi:hypothetical protein
MIEKGNNFFLSETQDTDNFYDKWNCTNHKKENEKSVDVKSVDAS